MDRQMGPWVFKTIIPVSKRQQKSVAPVPRIDGRGVAVDIHVF